MPLLTEPRIPDPDGFYEELIASPRALSDDETALTSAKLVLTLANHRRPSGAAAGPRAVPARGMTVGSCREIEVS